jgi:hypothetical protein
MLAILIGHLGKSVDRSQVGRIRHEQAFQLTMFCLSIPAFGGNPGIDLMELVRRQLFRRDVFQGLLNDIDPNARDTPGQSGAPDWDIILSKPLAGIEPSRGLVEGAPPNRQVGPSQPDSIVFLIQVRGSIEKAAEGLDRHGLRRQVDVLPKQNDPGFQRPLAPLVQVFPPHLDQPHGFISSALLDESGHEQDEQGGPIVAAISGGVVDELLRRRELPGFVKKPHESPNRFLREG